MSNNDSMIEKYNKFFKHANKSSVHTKFCKKVFDIDLTQEGFSDKNQLDFMIEKLAISQNDICLDAGCGNGKISNYINQKTKASLDGIDTSKSAIDFANLFFRKNKKLNYFIMDINNLELKENHYSVIYLIDSIYFSDNYEKTISDLFLSLKKNGRIAFFYSDFIFKAEKQKRKIFQNETKLAKIFHNKKWNYTVTDFTVDHFKLMKRKRLFSDELKEEYIKEGNELLFRKVNQESISQTMRYEDFEKFTNRYLYIIEK